MRGKQAFKNMVANLFLQVIVLLSGLILPRFILEAYGSSVNGMITSVNQFLTYLGLAEAGVGTATVVALYTPLALNQTGEVNSILSASRKFYNKSGMLFLALTIVLVGVYPYFISGQLDNSLVRWMIIVLSGSTLVDYFFLGKYRVLLTANQEGYVVALIQAANTPAMRFTTIFSVFSCPCLIVCILSDLRKNQRIITKGTTNTLDVCNPKVQTTAAVIKNKRIKMLCVIKTHCAFHFSINLLFSFPKFPSP